MNQFGAGPLPAMALGPTIGRKAMTHDDPVSHTSEWLTGGAPPQDADDETVGEMPWGPTPLPITYAPVRPGERFGPCLLMLPPGEANFADFAPREVGAWDGEDWYALGSGFIVHPTIGRCRPRCQLRSRLTAASCLRSTGEEIAPTPMLEERPA